MDVQATSVDVSPTFTTSFRQYHKSLLGVHHCHYLGHSKVKCSCSLTIHSPFDSLRSIFYCHGTILCITKKSPVILRAVRASCAARRQARCLARSYPRGIFIPIPRHTRRGRFFRCMYYQLILGQLPFPPHSQTRFLTLHCPAVIGPITEFIKLRLPKQSSAIETTRTDKWFSNDAPQQNGDISELSHSGLQLFENVINRQFRAVPEATAIFQTHQYTLCSPNTILCLLHHRPESVHNHIQVSVEDGQLFRGLRTGETRFLQRRSFSVGGSRVTWIGSD